MLGGHAVAEELVDGDVREEIRMQVETPLDKPKTVEHHGLDNVAAGEVVLPHLGDSTVDKTGDPGGVKGTGDDPEVAD